MSLHTWHCQDPHKPSSCATFMLNPHWGRAATEKKKVLHLCTQGCFRSVRLFTTAWTVACQALLSIRFSRQVGMPCPPLGDLSDPGIKPTSLVSPALAGRFFTTRTTWETPLQSCSSFLNLLTWRIAPYSRIAPYHKSHTAFKILHE